jgi:nitroreductase
MDVMTAVLTRRSQHRLTEPAPDDREFADLLRAAATAPDHGLLSPWRWILVRGEGRRVLGECFADDAEQGSRERAAAKPLRAPLLATLVFTPRLGHKVPEWEQLAATTGMTHAIMLLLHARGFGSIWRTGGFARSPRARRVLGLTEQEQLLGWLYIGTPEGDALPRRRAPVEVEDRLTVFRPECHRPPARCPRARQAAAASPRLG